MTLELFLQAGFWWLIIVYGVKYLAWVLKEEIT